MHGSLLLSPRLYLTRSSSRFKLPSFLLRDAPTRPVCLDRRIYRSSPGKGPIRAVLIRHDDREYLLSVAVVPTVMTWRIAFICFHVAARENARAAEISILSVYSTGSRVHRERKKAEQEKINFEMYNDRNLDNTIIKISLNFNTCKFFYNVKLF